MGADAGDYDGDARMDFVLTAFCPRSQYALPCAVIVVVAN
jgi:hypothetical protein